MEVKSELRYARTGVLKAREQARLIQGRDVNQALSILSFSKRKASVLMEKLLKSAVAQAEQKRVMDTDQLYIKSVIVNQGPSVRRFYPRARGSSSPYRKKQSHIAMVLEER